MDKGAPRLLSNAAIRVCCFEKNPGYTTTGCYLVFITGILSWSGKPEVASSIVQRIAIGVINDLSWLRIKNKTVQVYMLAMCGTAATEPMILFLRVPPVLRYAQKVFFVHDSHQAMSERDLLHNYLDFRVVPTLAAGIAASTESSPSQSVWAPLACKIRCATLKA